MFRPGQHVICADASNWFLSEYASDAYPTQDTEYTVRAVVDRHGVEALLLWEIKNKRNWYWLDGREQDVEVAFAARRFKPVAPVSKERELEAA